MSEPTTLEQVRDWHAKCATMCRRTRESALADQHQKMADAIDAAIVERDEWKAMVAEWRTKAATLEAQRNDALVRISDAPVGQSLGMVVYYADGQEHAAALLEGKRVRMVAEDGK